MKITIETTSAELAQLVDHLHLKEVPCILEELHEDFEETIPAFPKPEKKPNTKKGKGGRPKKKTNDGKETPEPNGDEPDDLPRRGRGTKK